MTRENRNFVNRLDGVEFSPPRFLLKSTGAPRPTKSPASFRSRPRNHDRRTRDFRIGDDLVRERLRKLPSLCPGGHRLRRARRELQRLLFLATGAQYFDRDSVRLRRGVDPVFILAKSVDRNVHRKCDFAHRALSPRNVDRVGHESELAEYPTFELDSAGRDRENWG